MVRVGGMTYACDPGAKIGSRISDMRLRGEPIAADKLYKVAGWAPVAEGASGEPIWDVAARYLREKKTLPAVTASSPRIIGIGVNP
jgi:sulfur-oxidizing protein SoxB